MSEKNPSIPTEKRLAERHNMQLDGKEHLFEMRLGDQVFPITDIRDVSVSGAGLELDHPITCGTQIILNYSEGDFELDINATIVWCNPFDNNRRFSIGIEFDPSNRGDNSLFFLAMRKYLDEFDGETIDS